MGRMKEQPRYNIISLRVSDELRDRLLAESEAAGCSSLSAYLLMTLDDASLRDYVNRRLAAA